MNYHQLAVNMYHAQLRLAPLRLEFAAFDGVMLFTSYSSTGMSLRPRKSWLLLMGGGQRPSSGQLSGSEITIMDRGWAAIPIDWPDWESENRPVVEMINERMLAAISNLWNNPAVRPDFPPSVVHDINELTTEIRTFNPNLGVEEAIEEAAETFKNRKIWDISLVLADEQRGIVRTDVSQPDITQRMREAAEALSRERFISVEQAAELLNRERVASEVALSPLTEEEIAEASDSIVNRGENVRDILRGLDRLGRPFRVLPARPGHIPSRDPNFLPDSPRPDPNGLQMPRGEEITHYSMDEVSLSALMVRPFESAFPEAFGQAQQSRTHDSSKLDTLIENLIRYAYKNGLKKEYLLTYVSDKINSSKRMTDSKPKTSERIRRIRSD